MIFSYFKKSALIALLSICFVLSAQAAPKKAKPQMKRAPATPADEHCVLMVEGTPHILPLATHMVTATSASRAKDLAVIGHADGTVTLWGLSTRAHLPERGFTYPTGKKITAVALGSSTDLIFLAGTDGTAYIYDQTNYRQITVRNYEGKTITAAEFSEKDATIIALSENGYLSRINVKRGVQDEPFLRWEKDVIVTFIIQKESGLIFAGTSNGKVLVYDPHLEKAIRTLTVHQDGTPVKSLSVKATGSPRIVSIMTNDSNLIEQGVEYAIPRQYEAPVGRRSAPVAATPTPAPAVATTPSAVAATASVAAPRDFVFRIPPTPAPMPVAVQAPPAPITESTPLVLEVTPAQRASGNAYAALERNRARTAAGIPAHAGVVVVRKKKLTTPAPEASAEPTPAREELGNTSAAVATTRVAEPTRVDTAPEERVAPVVKFITAQAASLSIRRKSTASTITAQAVSADGATTVLGTATGNVEVWSAAQPKKPLFEFQLSNAPVSFVAYSSGLGMVAAAANPAENTGIVRIWKISADIDPTNADAAKPTHEYVGIPEITSIGLTQNQQNLIVGLRGDVGQRPGLLGLNLASGTLIDLSDTPSANIFVGPFGDVAVFERNGVMTTFRVDINRITNRFPDTVRPDTVEFSRNEEKFVVIDEAGRALVFKTRGSIDVLSTPVVLGQIGNGSFIIPEMARISPNGKLVALVSEEDQSISIWESKTGFLLAQLQGFSTEVATLEFTSDTTLVENIEHESTKSWDLTELKPPKQ